MARSNNNLWRKALLTAPKLSPNESRLATALELLLLGWNKHDGYLGEDLIRTTAGNMHGRTFERARAGLIAKGLLQYERGSVGKGNRGRYSLILDSSEKPALPRVIEPVQKPAPARAKRAAPKARTGDTQKPAAARARRVRRDKTSPTTPELQPLIAKAIDAYRQHGGNLELADRKPALIGQVATLARNGTDERTILAACADLGRARAFPGHLKQRVDQITAAGGPCQWHNDRRGLTPPQLLDCGCNRCTEWAEALAAEVAT